MKRHAPPSDRPIRDRSLLAAVVALAVLTLALFSDVLFGGGDAVLSQVGADLSAQFIGWREFGFGQLREGHLALWNPHLFSGAPYFGGFQSALLYPPNWLHLVLPTAIAVNWGIALHVFLGGLFTYLWIAHRRLHPLASLTGAAIFMFGGATFLHIYAGHLPNICAMAWAPLLLLAIDGFVDSRSPEWLFLGAFAVGMQILAGHPQYVFYTALTAVLYVFACVVRQKRPWVLLAGVSVMFIVAAGLTAVQLLAGLDASRESVRSAGVPYDFARMFALPPENLLTLFVPGFFGDMIRQPYWGRCQPWEMSLFVGASGLVLAIYGAFRGDRTTRRHSLLMTFATLTLALGEHTPVYDVLYRVVPLFGQFRGTAKFCALTALFIAMLAAIGLDRLIRQKAGGWKAAAPVLLASLAAALAGWAVFAAADPAAPAAWWSGIMRGVLDTRESYLPPGNYSDAGFIAGSARFAAIGLWIAAATLVFSSALVWGANRRRWAAYLLALMVVAEVFTFARLNRPTFSLASIQTPGFGQVLKEQIGSNRILNLADPNSAMSTGAFDIWGLDPYVPLRYAQFIAWTQGSDPNLASQYVTFKGSNRYLDMLRLRAVLYRAEGGEGPMQAAEGGNPMPQVQLVHDWRLVAGRDAIFSAMAAPDFDPRRTVILESPPSIAPGQAVSSSESARIVDQTTDRLTIEADVSQPAVLLVTDSYSDGWRATALPGSSQAEYRVMPADYTLRGVPLQAGRHRLLLEYRPRAFVVGAWISSVLVVVYAVALAALVRRRRRLGP
jgi:hypothetical protein